MRRVTALVGAQYGSEGKGNIAKHIARDYGVHIRTGGPNAGHTIHHLGAVWKMRTVPCGWVNPDAMLVIGPGAVVDPELLRAEVTALDKAGYDVSSRIHVDRNVAVLSPGHHEFEGGLDGDAHARIGSTGEGVGIARMARMARETVDTEPFHLCESIDGLVPDRWITDTAIRVSEWIRQGHDVLLEGTQGSGLSLIHGRWPFVTSTDTNAAQLLADAGVAPSLLTDTILVARTFPIRVAGNSGPMFKETTWEEIGREPEQTTVTKLVRRVGKWDDAVFAKAVVLNNPSAVALTFCDYLTHEDAYLLRERIERLHNVKVRFMTWGPNEVVEC